LAGVSPGCGTGALTAEIADRGAEMLGVDPSEEMISRAREKFPALKLEVLDARLLRFNAEFDAVFSDAVLHWIPEAEQVIAGVAQALKPGGRFVAEFGGKGNIRGLVEGFHRAFSALGMREPDGVSPWFYPSIAEYAGLLEKYGLEVREASLFERPTVLEEGSADWKTGFEYSRRRSLKRRAKWTGNVGFKKWNGSAGLSCFTMGVGSWTTGDCELRRGRREREKVRKSALTTPSSITYHCQVS